MNFARFLSLALPTRRMAAASARWLGALLLPVLVLTGCRDRTPVEPIIPPPANALIAFVSNRDGNDEIYVMRSDGSEVRRLTDHPASDRDPAWSPDRSRIAFTSVRDGNPEIYVMSADGSGVMRLTYDTVPNHSPAWSPDGRRIAFVSEQRGSIGCSNSGCWRVGKGDIFVVNVDGTGLSRLTNDPDHGYSAPSYEHPAWSPDGRRIVLSREEADRASLFVTNSDGSSLSAFLSAANAFYTEPAWSPDGRRIAFRCAGLVCVINADGTELVQLTARSGASHRRPAWSPDGQRIVCAVAEPVLGEDLYVIKADGTGISRLTESPLPRYFDHPAWSPDAGAIALTISGPGMVPEIATINPDGTGLRTLLSLASPRREGLVWSANGRRLAYVDYREGNGEIFSINRDGDGLLNISNHPGFDHSPAWAPDSERIAFLSNRGDQQSIYVADGDGSGLTQLAHEATPGHFDWAPDGQRIAFERSSGGSRQVYVLRETDGALRQLTPQPGLLHHSGLPRWSPDGRKLAITSADVGSSAAVRVENLYVVNPEGSTANPDWSGVVQLTDHIGVTHTRVSWSPDGTRIAFVATRGIPGGPFSWVGTVDVGSREVRDVSPVVRSAALNLSWSPDSRQLVYMSEGALYIVDPGGLETRTLIRRQVAFNGQPAW